MRHRYDCPLRWADMDQLRHVNNVTYADYLQEARIDFFRTLDLEISAHGEGGGVSEDRFGIVVVRHEITYLSPLRFDVDATAVAVEIWVEQVRAASFTVGYEVFREGEDGIRTVYLRATTRLAPFVFDSERPRRLNAAELAALDRYVEPREESGPPTPRDRRGPAQHLGVGHYPVHVRFSDLDPYGHVNNVVYLEYFQEGRVLLHGRLWSDLPPGTPHVGLVVAQADLDYLRPMVARADGYDLWTWVRRVGDRSVVLDAEICEPGTGLVMARGSVAMVFFDSAAGRSVEPPAPYRESFLAAMRLVSAD